MRGPKPPAVALTVEERQGLEALVRRHAVGQQVVARGWIMLAAADGLNNREIAGWLGLTVNTVRHWRRRWLRLPSGIVRVRPVRPLLGPTAQDVRCADGLSRSTA